MSTYSELELNRYYLVKEQEDDEIALVQPVMETNECYLLVGHDDYENTFWRKKDDVIFEVVDELTDEQMEEYENLFEDDEELEEE